MAACTIQVERWNETDWAFLRLRNSDAPDTNVVRCIDYNIFRETPIPAEYRIRAGALVSLILHFPKRDVLVVEVRAFRNGDLWTAEAQIDEGDQVVYARGVAATPVEALVALSVEIQEY